MAKINSETLESFAPTREIVKKYNDWNWRALEGGKYEANDVILYGFVHKYTGSSNPMHVLIKGFALNDFYSTHVKNLTKTLCKIAELPQLDEKIERGDITVIEDILGCCEQKNISFASKYCCMHNNQAFPIYDSVVKNVLQALNKRDKFTDIAFTKWNCYKTYKQVYDCMIKHYELEEFDYRETYKCLWTKGKEIAEKA